MLAAHLVRDRCIESYRVEIENPKRSSVERRRYEPQLARRVYKGCPDTMAVEDESAFDFEIL
jgi:hypothetical protein